MENTIELRHLDQTFFDWKPLYDNNFYNENCPENGWYCLLLKEHEGKIYGRRYSIVYQREQIIPLVYAGLDAPIEQYIVFEKDYNVIEGKLSFSDTESGAIESVQYAALWDTLNDCDLNHPGNFERALPTLEEAKEYAVALANRAGFNLENVIDSSDEAKLMKYEYDNVKLKYQTILEFGRKYKEIMKVVAEYEFPPNFDGGLFICEELKKKAGIDRKLASEMLHYIPQILLPKNQRKAKEILELYTPDTADYEKRN